MSVKRSPASPLSPSPSRSPGVSLLCLSLGLSSLVGACGAPPTGRVEEGLAAGNGVSLNGHELNGHSLNGHSLNGHSLNGVSLAGVTLDGAALGELSLDGSRLRARPEDSADRSEGHSTRTSGNDSSNASARDSSEGDGHLTGATLDGLVDDGTHLPLRIDAVVHDARSGLWLYSVSYAADGTHRPLCTDAQGQPVAALALGGRWDASAAHVEDRSAFTFACLGYALSKCVELGYSPWQSVHTCPGCAPVSLAPLHQACTRLLRADYCGDGQSHTVDGTLINLYDALGIQRDTDPWALEAEWDEHGARCMARPRLGALMPPCAPSLMSTRCGDPAHFSGGTLLMDEVAPGIF